jgi:hypothetical protein
MTLKIERISGKRRTRIRLSGAFRSEHRDQVKAEIERGGPRIALDLEEVDLVDVEDVRFLNACEAEGISVLRCSPHIREWMLRERGSAKSSTHKRNKGKAGWRKKMESRLRRGAVASTSGNEHQRSQLTGNSKERRNCGARHGVTSTRGKALSHCASHNSKP